MDTFEGGFIVEELISVEFFTTEDAEESTEGHRVKNSGTFFYLRIPENVKRCTPWRLVQLIVPEIESPSTLPFHCTVEPPGLVQDAEKLYDDSAEAPVVNLQLASGNLSLLLITSDFIFPD